MYDRRTRKTSVVICESEISEIQNERMELLRKMLHQREIDYQAINDKRIEHLW